MLHVCVGIATLKEESPSLLKEWRVSCVAAGVMMSSSLFAVVIVVLVPECETHKVGEVITFIGLASVRERDKRGSHTELFSLRNRRSWSSNRYSLIHLVSNILGPTWHQLFCQFFTRSDAHIHVAFHLHAQSLPCAPPH